MRFRVCNILILINDLYAGSELPASTVNLRMCEKHSIAFKNTYINLISLYPSFSDAERLEFFSLYCQAQRAIHRHIGQSLPLTIYDPLQSATVPMRTILRLRGETE
jgi:hypothetical protein